MTTQVFARACAMIFAALAFSTGAMAQSGYGYNAAQLRGNVQDATVVQGVISVSMQKRNPEAKNSLATTT